MVELKQVRRVLYYTLILNIAVALAKILYGYRTDSISMLSDGMHSFFDGASNVIGLIGIWIASRPPDEDHPYGHRKYETLSTAAIALLILLAGIEILKKAYFGLTAHHEIKVTSLSFTIMGITLLINTVVMLYETKRGRELKSDILLADALHTKTDIFVSLSVIISLVAAKTGYPVIDVVVAVVIAFLIAKTGFGILKPAADVLTDTARLSPEEIKGIVCKINGIKGCHGIRTRGKEGAVNVDLHLLVDHEVRIEDAHNLAHIVEDTIKSEFPSVIDVIIHTEPYQKWRDKG
jgi:cation diffusion facilitator family transporter